MGIFPLDCCMGICLLVQVEFARRTSLSKTGAQVKPRYDVKEQWWWQFSLTHFSHGYMEKQMDRVMLGLKQQHETNWAGLSITAREEKKQFAHGIRVRDNRYIPQWVKIQVVLRETRGNVYIVVKVMSNYWSLIIAKLGQKVEHRKTR